MRLRWFTGSPSLSLTVAGTIAAGTAALTAVFGMANASLLRHPPFHDAGRLAMLYTTHTSAGGGTYRMRWSFARAQVLQEQSRTFAHLATYTGSDLILTGTSETERIRGEIVSARYFPTLAVSTIVGRTFLEEEDLAPGAHAVVVLGHDLWQRRYGGDPSVAGRTIGINGRSHTVVGVMPGGFRGLTDRAQLWIPTAMAPVLTYPDYRVTDQDFISMVGRLREGVSLERANAELATLVPGIYAAIPTTDTDSTDRPSGVAVSLNEARITPEVRRAVLLLGAAIAVLYALACANVTSLLLGRALARARETAVRAAMGSTASRLFALHFAEGAALVAAGGVAGVGLALWIGPLVGVPTDVWGPRNFYGSLGAFAAPAFSWLTVAFGVALVAVTSVIVPAIPALAALRDDVLSGLRDGPRGTSSAGTSLRRASARGVIIAFETALAVVLLVVGGLMIDSFRRMRSTPLGVDAAHVLTFTLAPPEVRVPPAAAPAYIDRMLAAITAVPGVVSATVDGGAPVAGTARSTLHIAGRTEPAGGAPGVLRHYVAPDHFATLGIPLVRGRPFTAQDVAGRPRVAIVSEGAARRFWPGADPIGQRVWFGDGGAYGHPDSSAEIVGIVGDVMYEPLDVGPNRSSFYTPYAQFTYGWRQYFVRAAGDPTALVAGIRRAVHAVEPDVPLAEVQALETLIGASWKRQRFDAIFFGAFAAVALALAASGIYAVVAYAVGQRTREMGIRLALGSRPHAVIGLVLREGMRFPMAGLVTGLALALAAAGAVRASLYGVAPTDARVLTLTIGLLLVVAAVACLVPAWRATRVDPCVALRSE